MILKTLKDIETDDNEGVYHPDYYLKEEAIKYIKELEALGNQPHNSISGACYTDKKHKEIFKIIGSECAGCSEGNGLCSKYSVICFIKYFFNITEEELK